MFLLPQVKTIISQEGCFGLPKIMTVKTDPKSKRAYQELTRYWPCELTTQAGDVRFQLEPTLGDQAYQLMITPKYITVIHSEEAGAFYAVKTLKQIMSQFPELPCLTISDEPDLKIRGYLLDISRNKIPTLKTLTQLIDLLSDLKYNHFELYVEGFSFYYPSFQSLYTTETPITIQDFRNLEAYCDQRCIDFVPNHNGLGHMSAWLKRPEFKDLANCEDGMVMWGSHQAASTLNPLDPKSLALVKTYTSDVLKIARSPYFHLNLDEPYELGYGKTEEVGKQRGVGPLYLDYVLKLYDHVKSFGKIPLIWGDVLNHYPELLSKLPKDLIFVDWGYDDDAPFNESLKTLSDHHVSFMSAPGTSSWNSITGRTGDSLENIRNACFYTKLYKGLGFLLTDWGDNGHFQPLSVSYLPLVYGASMSWSSSAGAVRASIEYLNTVIFEDKQKMMGEVMADLGRLGRYQLEYRHNATQILDVIWASNGTVDQFIEALKDHPFAQAKRGALILEDLALIKRRLNFSACSSTQGKAAVKELADTIRLMEIMIHSFMICANDQSSIERQRRLSLLKKEWPMRLKRYEIQWLKNNRIGGLNESLSGLNRVAKLIEAME